MLRRAQHERKIINACVTRPFALSCIEG